ncbi:MAG: hypothetical protein HYT87_12735 [Nitrospirae bacterium]|nr:hypothetical protein [Nitrospirota bacterium]
MNTSVRKRIAALVGGLCLTIAVLAGTAAVAREAAAAGTSNSVNISPEFNDIVTYTDSATSLTKGVLIPLLFVIGIAMFLLGLYIAKGSLVVRSLTAFLLAGFVVGLANKALTKINGFNSTAVVVTTPTSSQP